MGQRVQEICARLKAGACRAPPVRRVDIPKGPGETGTRPLEVPTVADRLLKKAVARILEAIFEADFCDFSYGCRPGRSPHHALRALRVQIVSKKVSRVFEADIRGYFNHVCYSWSQRMMRERIADPVILAARAPGGVIYVRQSDTHNPPKCRQPSAPLKASFSPPRLPCWADGRLSTSQICNQRRGGSGS